MTIHQFAEQLDQEGNPSPVLEALRALRARNLDDLRGPDKGYLLEWIPWGDDAPAQTPQIYVKRLELRN